MRALSLLVLVLASQVAWPEESILSFHSDVRVFADGMLEVTETITVRAEGDQIRRGIYRDFPVEYRDRYGNAYVVSMWPLGLLRNGEGEAYHSVRNRHDVRTYFGRSDRLLESGEHTYIFRYRANRLLGFFDDHDELYWNVTGNRWAFPIERATATVRLEFDLPRESLTIDGYTGRSGSKAGDYGYFFEDDGAIHFSVNRALAAAEGLTIAVGWPKGFVIEPSTLDRLGWLFADNLGLVIALGTWLLLLTYYIPVWQKYGKDPDEGVVVTRYTPPKDFSPASLRYIRQMYYDDKVMTAAIVNLAVKGYLEIAEAGKKHVIIKVTAATLRPRLAAGEEELYEALFKKGDRVELKQANHVLLGAARQKHAQSLAADYKQKYFRVNGLLSLPAILIILVAVPVSLLASGGPTPMVLAAIGLMIATLAFFVVIMKRPTIRGRKVLDEIKGFADYLEIAEKEELNLRNPPDKTPELFETYLPFALALGVDQEWSERFASVLASIRQHDGSSYSPAWYSGSWNSANLADTTHSFSRGLSSAVSSSTSAPGSSSGSSGGGSSGGGGGGGGGGGW